MDPTYLAAIAELVAAVAVVVSLLYLARQVRESTRQARLSSMQALYAQMQSVAAITATDREVARIFMDGQDGGLEALDKYDRVQFGQLCLHVFKSYEEAFHYLQEGVIDKARLRGFERGLLGATAYRGFQEFWAVYKALFDPAFQEYLESRMDELEPELDFRDYAERMGIRESSSDASADRSADTV